MNEDEVERLCRQVTPIAPSAMLEGRVAERVAGGAHGVPDCVSFSDRFLLATLSAGLIAACYIVATVSLDYTRASPPPSPGMAQYATPLDNQRLLAQLTQQSEP